MSDDGSTDRALKIVGGGLLAVIAAAVLFFVWLNNHPLVHVVNGLDVPIVVVAQWKDSARSVTVKPGGHDSMRLEKGGWTMRVATEAGAELETTSIDVPETKGVLAFNPLGAAPVFYEKLKYVPHDVAAADTGADNVVHFYGAKHFVDEDSSDHVFENLPSHVMVPDTPLSHETFQAHLDVLEGGWRTSVRVLLDRGDTTAAGELITTLLTAMPDLEDGPRYLAEVRDAAGPRAGQRIVDSIVETVRTRRPQTPWLTDFAKRDARAETAP